MKFPLLLVSVSVLMALQGFAWQDPAQSLRQIFEDDWAFRVQENPLLATSIGNHEANDRLPSVTAEDGARRNAFNRELMGRLQAVDLSKLNQQDRINHELFKVELQDRLAGFEFKSYLIPLNADSGFHSQFASLPVRMPFRDVGDYENYIKRLRAFPAYVNQHIELMREGLRIGMTLPRVVLDGIEVTMETHIVENVKDSVFYPPFSRFPAAVEESDRSRLAREGGAAILEGAVAGYRALLDFMTKEYIPGSRETIGASALPNGEAYYRQRVHYFTTLDISVEEVHGIGLQEVKRIREEMEAIIKEVGFEGDFKAFLEFLRTDPRFYAKTAEELLKEASYIAKRMDGKLPLLFTKFPRLPYTVAPVPDHLAPKYTGGRYVGPAIGGTEPGYYWVNTYALNTRPLYVLEALSLHEAVPGHHFQISLAKELEEVPNFRRFSYISAFGEGWGLYSERLGLEVGFYSDPYSNFGRLTYEMWRACRLVVDTGMHAMGWSRQKAMDYLAGNTALSLHECRTETDRYISWPGQALSYKMGELKIRELRAKAEKALGASFDLREFHDKILENGSVTLALLERLIDDYIAAKKAN